MSRYLCRRHRVTPGKPARGACTAVGLLLGVLLMWALCRYLLTPLFRRIPGLAALRTSQEAPAADRSERDPKPLPGF